MSEGLIIPPVYMYILNNIDTNQVGRHHFTSEKSPRNLRRCISYRVPSSSYIIFTCTYADLQVPTELPVIVRQTQLTLPPSLDNPPTTHHTLSPTSPISPPLPAHTITHTTSDDDRTLANEESVFITQVHIIILTIPYVPPSLVPRPTL